MKVISKNAKGIENKNRPAILVAAKGGNKQ